MALKLVAGAFVSTFLTMVWGFVFWMILLPPGLALQPFPGESAWKQKMEAELPASGSYLLPSQESAGKGRAAPDRSFVDQYLVGGHPVGMLHFSQPNPSDSSLVVLLARAAVLFVSALLGGMTLLMVMPAQEFYLTRVFFVCWLGIIVAVGGRLLDPAVWGLPWGYFLYSALHAFTNWIIIGVVMGWISKKQVGYVHYTDSRKPLWKRALDVD